VRLACAAIFFVQTFVFAIAAADCVMRQRIGAAIVGGVLAVVNLGGYVVAMHLWLQPRPRVP